MRAQSETICLLLQLLTPCVCLLLHRLMLYVPLLRCSHASAASRLELLLLLLLLLPTNVYLAVC
jgi:hypothetical protein